MTYDPRRHHRRSIRLRGWRYTAPGSYYVTLCTTRRGNQLGCCSRGQMTLNAAGRIAAAAWAAIPDHFANATLDAWVVMPDHVHGIVVLVDDRDGGDGVGDGAQHAAPLRTMGVDGVGAQHAAPLRATGLSPGSLGVILRSFKSAATREINALRGTPGEPVWQRNYYEHVVRSDADLDRIRRYIAANPARWRRP